MPSRDIRDLTAETRRLAEDLIAACEAQRSPIFLTATLRTFHEQDRLYALGRTAPGAVVTHARAGASAHNFGLAFDIAFRGPEPFGEDQPWDLVGRLGRELGLEWGGDWQRFPDRPHFELRTPISLQTRRSALLGRLRRGGRAPRDAVAQLQTLLQEAGYEAGPLDGDFGPLTESAVQRLQRTWSRLPTGIVQLVDLEALEGELP